MHGRRASHRSSAGWHKAAARGPTHELAARRWRWTREPGSDPPTAAKQPVPGDVTARGGQEGIRGTGVSDSAVPSGASVGEQQRESHIASGLGGMRKKKNTGYGNVALAALFWSYFRSALAILITIPTAVILARLLTPTEFGIATAAR